MYVYLSKGDQEKHISIGWGYRDLYIIYIYIILQSYKNTRKHILKDV